MSRRVEVQPIQPPPTPEDAKPTQKIDLAKFARQAEAAAELIDSKQVPGQNEQPNREDLTDTEASTFATNQAERGKYATSEAQLHLMRLRQQESADRRVAELRARHETQRIRDEQLLEEALEAIDRFPSSEEEAQRSHGAQANGWNELSISELGASLRARDAAEAQRRENQKIQITKKPGVFAKIGGFFKKLFNRPDAFERQVQEMENLSDAEVKADVQGREQSEQEAAQARAEAYAAKLETKAARGQGMVESAIMQGAEALQNGLDTATEMMYADGSDIPQPTEPKKDKWAKMAENDYDLMMADGAAETKRMKDEARAEAYAAKLETKAARGQGMAESAITQVGETINAGIEQFEDFVYQGRNVELGEDEPLLTLHGEAARERISDILKKIPAGEYQALLAGVENMDPFSTGGEAKQYLREWIASATDAEIERAVDSLTSGTTTRQFVETMGNLQAAA